MNARVPDYRTGNVDSWIAKERLLVPSGVWIHVLLSLVAAGLAGLLIWLALEKETLAVETEYDTLLAKGLHLHENTGRILTALAAGAAVAIWGANARRLYHSNGIGLATALLLCMDTGLLVQGHLIQPLAWTLLFGGLALLFALFRDPRWHWAIPLPLALLALETGLAIPYGAGIFLLLVARGHIYANPSHLRNAFWQVSPALIGLGATWRYDFFQAGAQTYGSTIHIHNPAIWYTGALAAVAGVAMALLYVIGQTKMNRIPGRIQLRLQRQLPRIHGRILWTALLWPMALPAFIMHLLGGIQALTDGNRAFRISIVAGVFAFAGVYLYRFWSFIDGTATAADVADLEELLPWIQFDS